MRLLHRRETEGEEGEEGEEHGPKEFWPRLALEDAEEKMVWGGGGEYYLGNKYTDT